ncbi:MAG: HD domain-containing protein, partial [Oscillospiraceae bacterium]|nr:HD domain-containing protein [Oscillospiraceae bacterium]
MELQKFKLAVGSLLHDTGKILYRYNDSRNHSDSGYDFLKEIISDKDILDCVKYHHSAKLKNSGVSDDALCYITYIADNIAAFSDRRKNETGMSGFVKNISYE